MHTGDLLTELLARYGVTHVFGVPGAQTSALFDGILKREPAIRHIIMRDECNSAFAADAFARLTRRIGVCDVTVGPGCVKLPSGLMEAHYSSIPILCVISELPQAWRHLYERGAALQAAEQERLISQFCKWVVTLQVAEHLPTMLAALLRRAVSGRPGPVALIIPQDVFDKSLDTAALETSIDQRLGQFPILRSAPDPEDVRRAAELLLASKAPVLIAGGGVHHAGATSELRELAELLTLPVATTFSGRGALEDAHPLSLGLLGNIGSTCAKEAAEAADVVLLVGFKSGQNSTFNWKLPRGDQKVIHIDIDPAEISKVFSVDVGLVGDAKLSLRALIESLTEYAGESVLTRHQGARDRISSWRAAWQAEVEGDLASSEVPVKPQRVMKELNRLTTADDVLCCDASYVTGWGMLFYQQRRAGKTVLAPRGSAGLGFGLPAAIGAACARPDVRIIALCGDHGVSYSIGELTTAVRYGLNIKLIVFNNQGSRWIDHYHRLTFNGSGEPFRWQDTDFATVGQGFGCSGMCVEQPQNLAAALENALAQKGPAVVDVKVSGEETPILAYRSALKAKQAQRPAMQQATRSD